MWHGAREVRWTPTEFSLALLEPFLPSKPCQISEPAPATSILQGNGCHWVSTPLIGHRSVLLRSFLTLLDCDICFWPCVAPILTCSR